MEEKTKFIADADGIADKRKPNNVLADQLSGVLGNHKIIKIERVVRDAEPDWEGIDVVRGAAPGWVITYIE